MGRGCAWTATEEAKLQALVAAGLTARAIANQETWPYSSVKKAVRKLMNGRPLRAYKGRQVSAPLLAAVSSVITKDTKVSVAEVQRKVAIESGIKVGWETVRRVMNQQNRALKPIKMQVLTQNQRDRRLAWCRHMLFRIAVAKGARVRLAAKSAPVRLLFLEKLVFEDEKIFRCSMPVHAQNQRIWVPRSAGTKRKIMSEPTALSGSLKQCRQQHNPGLMYAAAVSVHGRSRVFLVSSSSSLTWVCCSWGPTVQQKKQSCMLSYSVLVRLEPPFPP